MTFDDLMEDKTGLTNTISISYFIRIYLIFNLLKFYVFVTLYGHSMIFFRYFLCGDLWWPPKVKQGHSQMGSISSLHHNGITKKPWKFHAFPQICTIVALFETNPPY